MDEIKNILIVHPEGNIYANPNLFAIVRLLISAGFNIDYQAKHRVDFHQESVHPHLKGLRIKDNPEDIVLINQVKYCLVIGIDQGIIDAAKIAGKANIPLCYISYEIFFHDEIDNNIQKNEEIEACKNISFAVCQDPVRSYLLSEENKIPKYKILYIPVAGYYEGKHEKSYYLNERLKIPRNKKIALFAGSILKWSMIEDVIVQSDHWGENWVLVVHDRYNRRLKRVSELIKSRPHVFQTDFSFSSPEELKGLISSADVGIGFYQSNFTSAYEGKNLVFVGLSSGKLNTYLSYGVPVITNEIGQISDYVRDYQAGQVVKDISEMDPEIVYNLPNVKANCICLFKEKLDFGIQSQNFLKLVNQAITGCLDDQKIKSFNRHIDMTVSRSQIEQTKRYYNLSRDIYYSKYYRLGNYIYHPGECLSQAKKNLKKYLKKSEK
jgi:glycosyltransferase involved in cell wall biosynthesis